MKKGKGPVTNNPIHNHKWPDKGRKNMGMPTDGPVAGSPVKNHKWPTGMGRKNKM